MRSFMLTVAAATLWVPAVSSAASLQITTDPPGAAVHLDGVPFGIAPVTIKRVDPGAHELKVSAEGYLTRVDKLQVAADDDLRIHAPLNKIVKPVQPKTSSQPSPAPKDPAAVRLPPGIPPPLPPPPPTAQPDAVAPAVPSQPSAPLPVSQLPTAWGTQKKSCVLRVDTVPANALVQVVGMPGEKTAPAVFTGFSPGTVTLRVRAAGYQEKTVAVTIDGDVHASVVLEPAH